MQERLFFRFQLCNSRMLVACILFPFRLDFFNSFFDLRYPKRDFFLFLLQLLERDDFIAQLREIGRLGSAFASQIYFTFLEKASLLT